VTSISLYYDDPDFQNEENDDDDEDEGEGDDEGMAPPPPAPEPGELQRLQTNYRTFDEPADHWQWTPSVMVSTAPMAPVYGVPMMMVDSANFMPAHMSPMGTAEQQGVPQDAPVAAPPYPLQGGGGGGAPPAGPPMPQTLQRSTSVSTRATRIEWIVDARKLRGNDKQAVSPSFDLNCGGRTLPFKMMIYPKQVTDQKGGASFKKSRGRGSVTIKCEADLTAGSTPLSFRIYTGTGAMKQPPRGPVEHDFSASAVCTLPRNIEEWDFAEVQDKASSTFVVGLEVLTQ
jgi:hypothetical protein